MAKLVNLADRQWYPFLCLVYKYQNLWNEISYLWEYPCWIFLFETCLYAGPITWPSEFVRPAGASEFLCPYIPPLAVGLRRRRDSGCGIPPSQSRELYESLHGRAKAYFGVRSSAGIFIVRVRLWYDTLVRRWLRFQVNSPVMILLRSIRKESWVLLVKSMLLGAQHGFFGQSAAFFTLSF